MQGGLHGKRRSNHMQATEQALLADDEDDDFAEEENLVGLQAILRAVAETQRQTAGRDGHSEAWRTFA